MLFNMQSFMGTCQPTIWKLFERNSSDFSLSSDVSFLFSFFFSELLEGSRRNHTSNADGGYIGGT